MGGGRRLEKEKNKNKSSKCQTMISNYLFVNFERQYQGK